MRPLPLKLLRHQPPFIGSPFADPVLCSTACPATRQSAFRLQHGKCDVQESLMPIAAAVRIQACWRAVRVRRRIQPCTRLLLRRAAVAIQRCWRACE